MFKICLILLAGPIFVIRLLPNIWFRGNIDYNTLSENGYYLAYECARGRTPHLEYSPCLLNSQV